MTPNALDVRVAEIAESIEIDYSLPDPEGVRAAILAALNEVREECAKVCEARAEATERAVDSGAPLHRDVEELLEVEAAAARQCAAAIRESGR